MTSRDQAVGRKRRSPASAALAFAGTLVATLFAASVVAHDPPRTKVTWNGDIARIVNARCVKCHSPGGKGPMSLVTYDDARPWAKAIREEVLARRMPKWHAARGYGQFLNDPTLSPFEIALFVSWVDGGALPGTGPVKLDAIDLVPRSATGVREQRITMTCKARSMPSGRLLAITPRLADGASAGFVVDFPDQRREIVGWIKNYEPEFEETYWLETPLVVPAGSRLTAEGSAPCSVTLHMAR